MCLSVGLSCLHHYSRTETMISLCKNLLCRNLHVESIQTVEDLFTLIAGDVTWREQKESCEDAMGSLSFYLVLDCCDPKHNLVDRELRSLCSVDFDWVRRKRWRILFRRDDDEEEDWWRNHRPLPSNVSLPRKRERWVREEGERLIINRPDPSKSNALKTRSANLSISWSVRTLGPAGARGVVWVVRYSSLYKRRNSFLSIRLSLPVDAEKSR